MSDKKFEVLYYTFEKSIGGGKFKEKRVFGLNVEYDRAPGALFSINKPACARFSSLNQALEYLKSLPIDPPGTLYLTLSDRFWEKENYESLNKILEFPIWSSIRFYDQNPEDFGFHKPLIETVTNNKNVKKIFLKMQYSEDVFTKQLMPLIESNQKVCDFDYYVEEMARPTRNKALLLLLRNSLLLKEGIVKGTLRDFLIQGFLNSMSKKLLEITGKPSFDFNVKKLKTEILKEPILSTEKTPDEIREAFSKFAFTAIMRFCKKKETLSSSTQSSDSKLSYSH
jgi:hypothetical protein